MKHLRARAMVYAFLMGVPIPPNDIAAEIMVALCAHRYRI